MKLERTLAALLMPPRPNARSGRRAWLFALGPVCLALMASGTAGLLHLPPIVHTYIWIGLGALHPLWLAYTVQWSFAYFVGVTLPVHALGIAILLASATAQGQPAPEITSLASLAVWTVTLPLGALLTAAFSVSEALWIFRGRLND